MIQCPREHSASETGQSPRHGNSLMREKNYNTGLRGVLFEQRHYARMGSAIWLYGWLVLRQTHQSGSVGWVLGGTPISYREIEAETGFNPRTLERWLRTLRREGYVETEAAASGVVVRITKAKKFAQPPRNSAGGARGPAGRVPQSCVASAQEKPIPQHFTDGIGSSSVVRNKGIETHREIHGQTENHSGLLQTDLSDSHPGPQQYRPHNQSQNSSYEARERLRLLRFEREEAVRRELAVGTGPEVRRS